jgi:hypothetical protein
MGKIKENIMLEEILWDKRKELLNNFYNFITVLYIPIHKMHVLFEEIVSTIAAFSTQCKLGFALSWDRLRAHKAKFQIQV